MNINYYFETQRFHEDTPMLSMPRNDNSCKPHIHKSLEILYVVTGHNRATINGNTVVLTNHQMAIADSYDIHSWEAIDDFSICIIIPAANLVRFAALKANRTLSANFILDCETCKRFKEVIDLLFLYFKTKTITHNFLRFFEK